MGDTLTGLLDGAFATFTATLASKKRKPADVAAINAAVDEGNAGVQAAVVALDAASRAFEERWGITAFDSWQATQERR